MDFGLFGIGLPQILLILLVAMLVFGPDKLPGIARQAGHYVNELRRMSQEARTELSTITKELDLREDLRTVQADLAEIKKDLSVTGQALLSDIQDVKKEVDVSGALRTLGQNLEQAATSTPEAALDPQRQDVIQAAVADTNEISQQVNLPPNTQANEQMSQEVPDETAVPFDSDTTITNAPASLAQEELNGASLAEEDIYQKIQALEARVNNNQSDIYQRLVSLEVQLSQRLDRLEQRLAEPAQN
jgi:sec-independent protein translocase protein TatB